MTHSRKSAAAILLFAFLAPSFASGQTPPADPTAAEDKLPNILFIVDTSGSMEYQTGSNTYPDCTSADPTKNRSRWIQVLEALTGNITDYSCETIDRSSSGFRSEFSMSGSSSEPPDANYRNPYHRPLSGIATRCAMSPGAPIGSNAFVYTKPKEIVYPLGSSIASCNFDQGAGFIDTFNSQARFGLMTFDTLPNEETGHDGASSYTINNAQGVRGAWSYYSGTPASGRPADCSEYQTLEVGVRNGGAPTSEGKMVYFGADDTALSLEVNERVQEILLLTRPYGATPLNGALEDARHFFFSDSSAEPSGEYGSITKLSPRYDAFVDCGCREQHIILITDGEPNLDLRPHCENAPSDPSTPLVGKCPYPDTPVEILEDLASANIANPSCPLSARGSNQYPIYTHVIGFSTEEYAPGKLCKDLRADHPQWDANVLAANLSTPFDVTAGPVNGLCAKALGTDSDEDLKVCCTLHQLAKAGSKSGSGMPEIAPTGSDLEAALGSIMKTITGKGTASATQPVVSPGVGLAEQDSVAFRIFTSYSNDSTSGLWSGKIERQRWECVDGAPVPQKRDESVGDNFSKNTADGNSGRTFVTFKPSSLSGGQSLRPWLIPGLDDGLGQGGGTLIATSAASLAGSTMGAAMALDISHAACGLAPSLTSPDACAQRVLKWTLGDTDDRGKTRCLNAANCDVIGDVMHSTPKIVNRPTAPVEDESYTNWANEADIKSREMMVYVSSNDGLFHGFALSPNGSTPVAPVPPLNERFAFIPPAVLPALADQYGGVTDPGKKSTLLDGVAVVEDVVATKTGAPPNYEWTLERDFTSSSENTNKWRTIMVQSLGGSTPGYFALDITKPAEPQFLWQLTETSLGKPLFGTGGTPLITTINSNGKEIAVAVLPGGLDNSTIPGTCTRYNSPPWANTHYSSLASTGGGLTFEPRTEVNCSEAVAGVSQVAARSLTIVRLDSGQVIRTFRTRPFADLSSTPISDLYGSSFAQLDSPITGAPAAFPAGTGMIADRIFVGDQEGTMWRVDVSNSDPRKWTMQLFFDAYSDDSFTQGRAITQAPLLSVNRKGEITVNFTTGTNSIAGDPGDIHYVYSLTEAELDDGSDFYAKMNWRQRYIDGEHVVGPMSLVGGTLYYSTIIPAPGNPCISAGSRIWGVDYLENNSGGVLTGGLGKLKGDQFVPVDGTIVGVTPEFVPSCATEATLSGGASYLAGARTAVRSPTPSNLQLVFQTNKETSDSKDSNFDTHFGVLELDPPRTASTILSWAAILE